MPVDSCACAHSCMHARTQHACTQPAWMYECMYVVVHFGMQGNAMQCNAMPRKASKARQSTRLQQSKAMQLAQREVR